MTTARKRPAPATGNRPSPNTIGYAKSNALTRFYGVDERVEALTADDREDLAVITAAVERGYRIAVQCLDCGHWLSSPSSVRRHRGPKCAARIKAVAG